jgi:transcriptional regulator
MYRPDSFREDRKEVLYSAIRSHPLATIVTAGAGGLMANLIPMTVATDGVLQAHMARANTQLLALKERAETLLIFHGPQAYVSPSFYPSKAEHGRVVPTWNYVVVQVRGTPRVIDDEGWLRAQLVALTADHEQSRSNPWKVADAPPSFIDGLLGSIIGFEIEVHEIEGKWKVSQNRSPADRSGVADALEQQGDGLLASLVRMAGAS